MGDERKMAFYEINEGNLGVDFQTLFEKAQRTCFETAEPVEVSLKLVVNPPEGPQGYGSVAYSMAIKEPKIQSPKLFTRLNGCWITNDNKDLNMVDQMALELYPKKTAPGQEAPAANKEEK